MLTVKSIGLQPVSMRTMAIISLKTSPVYPFYAWVFEKMQYE